MLTCWFMVLNLLSINTWSGPTSCTHIHKATGHQQQSKEVCREVTHVALNNTYICIRTYLP
jgi:hypothetical protein